MLAGMEDPLLGEYGGGSAASMQVGPCMFETLGTLPKRRMGPSADEMAAYMQRLQVRRKVTMKDVHVCTFDLSDDDQRAAYEKTLKAVMEGLQLRTHVVLFRPPSQLVQDAKGCRYIAHIEWMEFVLHETPVEAVGRNKEIADEQDGTGAGSSERGPSAGSPSNAGARCWRVGSCSVELPARGGAGASATEGADAAVGDQ